MRKCPVCRAAHFIAHQAAEATETTAKVLFQTVAMFLTTLCFLCPLNARAEEPAPCSAELNNNPVVLNNNPVVALARFIKAAGPPPCKILSLLSAGRVNIVTPPKVMVNTLMDVAIALASNRT